jgi:DNA primase
MQDSLIDEIKARLDIVDVVSSYLNLKKTGSNYRAVCPFHSEKNPSFFVSPKLQIFKCFGCGASGDIFKFTMLIEGVEFGDALKILAQRAGIELKPIDPKLKTERTRLYEICELATRFFEKQMESKKGQEVRKYLLKRKIREESQKEWRIGWAPLAKDSLISFLISKGYKKEEIRKAGLAFQKENGQYIDFFRERIIFPIFDLNLQPIAFAGRIFGKEEGPKYINSPNTLLYDKSKTLYGLDKGKVKIRQEDFCILVEGYTDVILAHQEGFENTVSVSGTSLTPYQLSVLKRYTENLYLGFDMDIAGTSATKRGINMATLKGFNIKVLMMPEGKDPADILSGNPKDFEKIVKNAVSIMDFYFQKTFSKYDKNTLEGKKEISKILIGEIKRIQNEIEKSFWISKLAKELDTREEDIRIELAKTKIEEEEMGLEESEVSFCPPKTRKEVLEEKFLSLLLKNPENLNSIKKESFSFLSEELREILEKMERGEKLKLEDLTEKARDLYTSAALKSEMEEVEEEKILSELKFCEKEICKISIKEKLNKIGENLRIAEKEKDFKKVNDLSKDFTILSKKLIEYEKN